MHGGIRVVGAIVIAGCASVREPSTLTDEPVVVEQGTGVSIIGPDYQLDFAATNIHMPQQLTIAGVPRMSGDVQSNAYLQHGAGVNLQPIFNASAPDFDGATMQDQTHYAAVASTLDVQLAGPAIARVRVGWTIAFRCDDVSVGGTHTAHGVSTFTTFPSGKIVRTDVASATDHALAEPTSGNPITCGLFALDPNDSDLLSFNSYWTFNSPLDDDVDATGAAIAFNRHVHMYPSACATYDDRYLGVVFGGTESHITDDGLNWFGYDFVNSMPRIDTTEYSTETQYATAPRSSGCGAAIAALATPVLAIDGVPLVVQDGLAVDPVPHPERFALTSTGTTPAGFAIEVDLGGHDHLELHRSDGVEGDGWFIPQADGASTILWFRDALPPDVTIDGAVR